MFDIIKSFKKVTGLTKTPITEVQKAPEEEKTLAKKIDKVSSFFDKALKSVLEEFDSIKEKAQDLSATNYNLGMQYMEEGNLKEAIFRFKITKKFWPNNHEAYYQLIICLILNHDFEEAEKVMNELLAKDPSYKEKIDRLTGNAESSLNPEQPEKVEIKPTETTSTNQPQQNQ